MQMIQTRRDFLASAVRCRRREHPWRSGIARRRGAAGDDHDPDRQEAPASALRPRTSPRSSCAWKVSPTSTMCRGGGLQLAKMVARGEIDFGISFAGIDRLPSDAGVPITALAGVHPGCYELFAHEPIRTIGDLKGRGSASRRWARAGTCTWPSWRSTSGSTSRRTSTGSRRRPATPWSYSPRAETDAFSASRPSRRSCAPARSAA